MNNNSKKRTFVSSMPLLLASLVWATVSHAEPAFQKASEVDDTMRSLMSQQNIPGAVVTILKDGKPLYTAAYGISNLETKTPATTATVFQSGSVGKMFTSSAIMLLVQDGKIKLDDPIAPFFPEVKGVWDGITIRQVMLQRSGIRDYEEFNSIDIKQNYSDEQLIGLLSSKALDFPPGTQYRYSNSGYIALGILIKRASGKFYGDLLQERLFSQCNMKTAQVNVLKSIIPNRAAGYVSNEGPLENPGPVAQTLSETADGSLLLTINDLAAWDACLSNNKPLTRESVATEWEVPLMPDGTQPVTGYGTGWRNNVVNGHRVIDHSGSFQGFRAHYARFENGLSVALLTNLESARGSYIVRRVAGIIEPGLLPLEKEIAGSAAETQKTKSAIIALMNGSNDPLLGSDIHKVFDNKHVEEIESSFIKVTPDTNLVQVNEEKDNSVTLRTYKATGKKVNYINAEFADNKIVGLKFSAE
ncbi:beta-lactamase family protein [Pseudomonas sp. PCH199]|uniref:serine hydrolase domain-containing protein n=1 Tax=unclassified Pseudomonas TaxID=196821 RepID=UPI000BC9B0E7|nr:MULTISPECIES: serine hydrolase domain-containing protein [unclassified Pseudomonas]MCW8278715.1 beta-lactamase family protein [Pseudomonas sp. PCH199]PAM81042.1 serine hydrolase [Pseudomonas sp. ERMR1:02]